MWVVKLFRYKEYSGLFVYNEDNKCYFCKRQNILREKLIDIKEVKEDS